jgi:hypothetical protein
LYPFGKRGQALKSGYWVLFGLSERAEFAVLDSQPVSGKRGGGVGL